MNRNIGNIRREIHALNQQSVYEAILFSDRPVQLREIILYLDELTELENKKIVSKAREKYENGQWTEEEKLNYIEKNRHKTISAKTIQRCISNDPRIQRNGRRYTISQKSRFESRYLGPESFGRQMIHEIIGRLHPPARLEKRIKYFALRFGAYVLFNFIEAVRPFHDYSLSVREREDLVPYWAREAIPIDYMFNLFQGSFDNRTRLERRSHDRNRPSSEMRDDRIQELLTAMKKAFPEIYGDLRNARKVVFGKTIKEVNGVVTDTLDDLGY